MALGLTACATKQISALDIDYSKKFLTCVVDFGGEYHRVKKKTGRQPIMEVPDCVDKALAIWSHTVK